MTLADEPTTVEMDPWLLVEVCGEEYDKAITLVRTHRTAVLSLADALLEHGGLDGNQVRDIAHQVSSRLPAVLGAVTA
jgi:hypothetical protein